MNFLQKLAIFIACYSVFHMFILRPYIAGCVCTSQARLDGKTAIITGSNTGIGKETALDLARRGARVIMACRNLEKANAALKEIVEKSGNDNIVVKHLDLASLKSVREFADDINRNEDRLDILTNNAGIFGLQTLTKTEDGLEMTMAVNHFGHFLLTNLLLELLKKSAPSRVVIVSAMGHWLATKTGLLENMRVAKYSYSFLNVYQESKLANILFARELARRLQGMNVTANSLHPGVIATEIARNLPTWIQVISAPIWPYFSKTPEQGAQTTIHLAVSEELEATSGLYFSNCQESPASETAQDDETAMKIWELSAKLVGLAPASV